MVLALTAVGLALLLVTVLSLSLSARAEPVADDPTVEKQVSTDQAAPGEILTYTIYILHEGTEASLWMTDTLPPEVTYVSGSLQQLGPGTASYSNGAITWSDPDFGFGNWVYITFTVEISPDLGSTTVVNTAEVTGTGTLVTASASTGIR